MKRFVTYLFIVMAGCAFSAAAEPDEEDVYFILMGQADQAIKDENYPEAEHRLVEAMAIEPNNPSNVLLLSNLGMVYSYMDRDSLALEAYDEALRRAPEMTTVLQNRARLHLKMGNDIDAYSDFGAVVDRDSLNAEARYYHGMIALYGGKLEQATADFDILSSVAPDSYNTWSALAALYSLTERSSRAIPYYIKLIEADPSPEYCSALAGCYLAEGRHSEASSTIADALKLYSHDPELYYYRAWLNRDRYLLDDARADAELALRYGADPRKVARLFER